VVKALCYKPKVAGSILNEVIFLNLPIYIVYLCILYIFIYFCVLFIYFGLENRD
jgi:hypothetical protein